MPMNTLHDVMVDLLKDTYHAEKQLIKALPKMVKATNDDELRSAFEDHLRETEGHVERLEQAFDILEMKPTAKVCHGMLGLIEEGSEVIKEKSGGQPTAIDAALLVAAQKVEHYEICAYGTLATFADTLGLSELADIFKATLAEEEAADATLNDIAEGSINAQAAMELDDDESDSRSTVSSRKRGRGRAAVAAGRAQRR